MANVRRAMMTGTRSVGKHFRLSRGERVLLTMVVAGLAAAALVAAGYTAALVRMDQYGASTAAVDASDTRELDALQAAYGPARNSRGPEEWIVRDYFKDERGGVFVDVGANHYQRFSNTYFLETTLGWSGVAIEPQTAFAEDYARHRPRTTFVPLFVSNVSDQATAFYTTENDLVASSSREFTAAFGPVTSSTVRTSTLDDILDRLGIRKVDFLSMDIEMAEPEALAGFSLTRFKPRLVAVEAHLPIRQQLLDYFTRHQYSLVGKYWRVDSENFWFAPTADR